MSLAGVGMVIEKLVADEDLRARFVLDPLAALAEMLMHGVELGGDEIDLFCRTDVRMWFLNGVAWEPGRGISGEGWYGVEGHFHVDPH